MLYRVPVMRIFYVTVRRNFDSTVFGIFIWVQPDAISTGLIAVTYYGAVIQLAQYLPATDI